MPQRLTPATDGGDQGIAEPRSRVVDQEQLSVYFRAFGQRLRTAGPNLGLTHPAV